MIRSFIVTGHSTLDMQQRRKASEDDTSEDYRSQCYYLDAALPAIINVEVDRRGISELANKQMMLTYELV